MILKHINIYTIVISCIFPIEIFSDLYSDIGQLYLGIASLNKYESEYLNNWIEFAIIEVKVIFKFLSLSYQFFIFLFGILKRNNNAIISDFTKFACSWFDNVNDGIVLYWLEL